MAKSRSIEKWNNQFTIVKTLLSSMESHRGNDILIRDFCIGLRNPIIFDNTVKEVIFKLPYKLENYDINESMTHDHLIGISNIVLYIFENRIYQRWNSVDDFKKTMKAFQVLLEIPKKLNNKGTFKSWQFNVDNINECIRWDIKLKKEGISSLINKNGDKVTVEDIWNDWHKEYESYL